MQTVKRSIRDIIRFINVGSVWQQKTQANSQLKYAISRTLKTSKKVNEDFEERENELNLRYCTCDEKGNIAAGVNGQFIFAKEKLPARNKERMAMLDEEVELQVYYVQNVKSENLELTAFEEDAFEGFVLPELSPPPESGITAGTN